MTPEGMARAFVRVIFASMSGLWGVMVTDMFQFCITMSSSFAAAYFAVKLPQVGGLRGLWHHIAASHPQYLSILPHFTDWKTSAAIFIIPRTVSWWTAIPAAVFALGAAVEVVWILSRISNLPFQLLTPDRPPVILSEMDRVSRAAWRSLGRH